MTYFSDDIFENPDAVEWLNDFCREANEETLIEAFEAFDDIEDEGLEAVESYMGLAAAEVVAALHGKPSASLPLEAKRCIKRLEFKPDEKLLAAARKTVERVKGNPMLLEFQEKTDRARQLQATVDDLLQRLKSNAV